MSGSSVTHYNSTASSSSSTGHQTGSSSVGSRSNEKKKKQDKDVAAIGSQFWGVADNDYGYSTQLSIDDATSKPKTG